LKTDFEIQYFFNTFNTAWEPFLFADNPLLIVPKPASEY